MSFITDAAKYYAAEPHQDAAWEYLWESLDPYTQEAFMQAYRDAPVAPEPSGPAPLDNSWNGIYKIAKELGAKYPECVAAQWALESSWGTHVSGKNNYFGIKGKGTMKTTWEDYGYGPVTIQDEFKDFATPRDCIDHLITQWYKDYKGYKGVNRATYRDECPTLLRSEGYATDPAYAAKLIRIMNQMS